MSQACGSTPVSMAVTHKNPRRVFIFGQKCGVVDVIKRELRCPPPLSPSSDLEGRWSHRPLLHRAGDAANVILSRILARLRALGCLIPTRLNRFHNG